MMYKAPSHPGRYIAGRPGRPLGDRGVRRGDPVRFALRHLTEGDEGRADDTAVGHRQDLPPVVCRGDPLQGRARPGEPVREVVSFWDRLVGAGPSSDWAVLAVHLLRG